MAKVMMSLPDDLLSRIDDRARRRGTSRSGLLRELAERELRDDAVARRSAVRAALASAAPRGGMSAQHVRKHRQAQ